MLCIILFFLRLPQGASFYILFSSPFLPPINECIYSPPGCIQSTDLPPFHHPNVQLFLQFLISQTVTFKPEFMPPPISSHLLDNRGNQQPISKPCKIGKLIKTSSTAHTISRLSNTSEDTYICTNLHGVN